MSAAVGMWRMGDVWVLWCRAAEAWQQVSRWSFARWYAVVTDRRGAVIAKAYTIPHQRRHFAAQALGLSLAKRKVIQTAAFLAGRERTQFKRHICGDILPKTALVSASRATNKARVIPGPGLSRLSAV